MNNFERMQRMAQRYKETYPPGTRIMLLSMGDDPRPVADNTRGTVNVVDDIGTLHCSFDNGRRLGVVPGEDSFRKLTDEELAQENSQVSHSVLFSKVEIWSDDGCEGTFFVGGIPTEYGDLTYAEDFDTFIDEEGQAGTFNVKISTYSYGSGETEDADDEELREIKEKFNEDTAWMSELTPLEDSEFTFELDEDELFGQDENNDFNMKM